MDKLESIPDGPIRVAYLIDNLGVAGTEQWLVRLINGLDRSQVEPFLCLLDGENVTSRSQEPSNISVLRLGLPTFKNPFSLLRAGRKFVGYLKQQKINIVQLQFTNSTRFGAPLARLAGVAIVLSTSRNTGYWVTPKLQRKVRWAHRFVTATIANSNASKQAAIDAFGLRLESMTVIPNGVDTNRFLRTPPVRMTRPAGQPWRVGMVANLRPVKDIPTFIRAAFLVQQSIPNVEFVVIGEGPQRQELELLVQNAKLLDRFHILGTTEDIPKFLGALDVAVLCSLSEGCSNALLEYMAAGRPIVATATGGNLDLICNRETGLLVPVGDEEALANAIVLLLHDRVAAHAMAAEARKLVCDRLHHEQEHRSYSEFYRQLVSRCSSDRQGVTQLRPTSTPS